MEKYKKMDYTLVLIGLVLLIAILASCSSTRDGWGCNGRGKYMTRVRL